MKKKTHIVENHHKSNISSFRNNKAFESAPSSPKGYASIRNYEVKKEQLIKKTIKKIGYMPQIMKKDVLEEVEESTMRRT